MSLAKKTVLAAVLCALLLLSGLTFSTQERFADSASPEQIAIWKDAEGVTHIEAGSSLPGAASLSPLLPEPAATPTGTQDENAVPDPPPPAIDAQADHMRAQHAQEHAQVCAQLRAQHKELETQFIRARNKGDGYAQIRLRHLLDANRKEQERVQSAGSRQALP